MEAFSRRSAEYRCLSFSSIESNFFVIIPDLAKCLGPEKCPIKMLELTIVFRSVKKPNYFGYCFNVTGEHLIRNNLNFSLYAAFSF